MKVSGIKIWIIFIKLLKKSIFLKLYSLTRYLSRYELTVLKVTAPKACGQTFFPPICVMMKWIFGDVSRVRYFGILSAKEKCSGEKSTLHNLALIGLSLGTNVSIK